MLGQKVFAYARATDESEGNTCYGHICDDVEDADGCLGMLLVNREGGTMRVRLPLMYAEDAAGSEIETFACLEHNPDLLRYPHDPEPEAEADPQPDPPATDESPTPPNPTATGTNPQFPGAAASAPDG